MSGISTVWEDTDGCAKEYRCVLDIYLMTVLSSSNFIITYHSINTPGHVNNVGDVLNATDKRYLKGEMEFIGKLSSNHTINVGTLSSASKDVSIKFSDQCLHIINDKEILNGIKGSTEMQK